MFGHSIVSFGRSPREFLLAIGFGAGCFRLREDFESNRRRYCPAQLRSKSRNDRGIGRTIVPMEVCSCNESSGVLAWSGGVVLFGRARAFLVRDGGGWDVTFRERTYVYYSMGGRFRF